MSRPAGHFGSTLTALEIAVSSKTGRLEIHFAFRWWGRAEGADQDVIRELDSDRSAVPIPRPVVMFVKPFKSTNSCSDPSATVGVAPAAMMTVEQMRTLYASATSEPPSTTQPQPKPGSVGEFQETCLNFP